MPAASKQTSASSLGLHLSALLAYALVALLAWQLSLSHFHSSLNSDHLYPHMFIKDLLYGQFPIDAWKFGSANFIFPDYLLYIPLYLATGESGLSFPLYSALIYLLLTAATSLLYYRSLPLRAPAAALAGALSLALILSTQYLPHHGTSLYFISLPGFHGSSQAIGLFSLALLLPSLLKQQKLSRRCQITLLLIATPALFSNTLLFTQYLFPWLVLLSLFALRHKNTALLKEHSLLIGLILALTLLLRLGFSLNHYWDYGKLFRHYPMPLDVGHTALEFARDFFRDLIPKMFAFWLLFALSLAFTLRSLWAKNTNTTSPSTPQALLLFITLSLASGIALPILALYWQDYNNIRYFLNLLILPTISLSALLIHHGLSPDKKRLPAPLLNLALLAALIPLALHAYRHPEQARFPYPPAVKEFDAFVKYNKLRYGLAGYWQSHLYNQLSKTGTHINHIRPDGSPYYWCNNIYWYWGDPLHPEAPTAFPQYDFVILNDLDPQAIKERYGEPSKVVRGGLQTLYLYQAGSRIQANLEPAIREYLKPKRYPLPPLTPNP